MRYFCHPGAKDRELLRDLAADQALRFVVAGHNPVPLNPPRRVELRELIEPCACGDNHGRAQHARLHGEEIWRSSLDVRRLRAAETDWSSTEFRGHQSWL